MLLIGVTRVGASAQSRAALSPMPVTTSMKVASNPREPRQHEQCTQASQGHVHHGDAFVCNGGWMQKVDLWVQVGRKLRGHLLVLLRRGLAIQVEANYVVVAGMSVSWLLDAVIQQ
eukprot:scaffold1328_cov394-Prasinococcus_capsulatus_cf.AAC.45